MGKLRKELLVPIVTMFCLSSMGVLTCCENTIIYSHVKCRTHHEPLRIIWSNSRHHESLRYDVVGEKLVQDILEIIAITSARLYGARSQNNAKLLKLTRTR